jgi:archaemetzincin
VDDLSIQVVAANLQALMDLTTDILAAQPVCAAAFMEARRQYDAVTLIRHLAAEMDGPGLGLGLTGSDLGTPILTYVLGESQLGGRVAVVSGYRLTGDGLQRMLNRLIKVSLHEMAHVLGLGHCFQPRCLMRSPRNVSQLDDLPLRFCKTCRYEITRRVGSLAETMRQATLGSHRKDAARSAQSRPGTDP